jgi:hypothetical protein
MVERAVRRRAGEVPAEGTALMHDPLRGYVRRVDLFEEHAAFL